METGTDTSAAAEGVVVAELGIRVVGVFGGRKVVIYISVWDILNIGYLGFRSKGRERQKNSEQLMK